MFEDTRNKLREADFFLRHLDCACGSILKNTEGATFYLSAFLCAGRSVDDRLEKAGGDEYRSWLAQRKESLTQEQALLLGFTKEQSGKSVRIGGPEIERSGDWVPAIELQQELLREGGSFTVIASAPQGASAPMVWRSTIRFIRFPETSIVDVCRNYLALMNEIVSEYEAHRLCLPSLSERCR
jgi:hypothetical protein